MQGVKGAQCLGYKRKDHTWESPSEHQDQDCTPLPPAPPPRVSSYPSFFLVSGRVSQREPWLSIEKVVKSIGFK